MKMIKRVIPVLIIVMTLLALTPQSNYAQEDDIPGTHGGIIEMNK